MTEIEITIMFNVHSQMIDRRGGARILMIFMVMAILGRSEQMIARGIEIVCHSIVLNNSGRLI